MTSVIPVWCFTDWTMKPHWKLIQTVTAIEHMANPTSKPEHQSPGICKLLFKIPTQLVRCGTDTERANQGQGKFHMGTKTCQSFHHHQTVGCPAYSAHVLQCGWTPYSTDRCKQPRARCSLATAWATWAYFLSRTEQGYATIEKECIAIMFGCERFSQYLVRREKIQIETDHKPLESIFRKSLLAAPSQLQGMLLRLQHFSLCVRYKTGCQVFFADHLSQAAQQESRKPEDSFQVFSNVHSENCSREIGSITMLYCTRSSTTDTQDNHSRWVARRERAVPVNIPEYWYYREDSAQ